MTSGHVDVAVLGAGNGGVAAAADLGLRGFTCALTNRSPERLEPFRQRGGVEATGATGDAFVPVARITADLAEAVEGAKVVMLTVPASGQEYYARALAPLLHPEQLIVLNASNTGSALHVARLLAEGGAPAVPIVELNSLTYICRMASPTRVNITGRARTTRAAVLPATRREEALARFGRLYPQAQPVDSVLVTSLTNLNAVLHPPGMLLNAGWIEHTAGDFFYYYEGITPAVARAIEAVDRDRLAVAEGYGVAVGTFLDYFYAAGYTSHRAWAARSVFEAMKDSVPNRYIKAQPNLEGRYIKEDVAFGLVPLQAFAAAAGVSTPTVDALIHLASVATGVDYAQVGLTAGRLGLEGAGRADVLRLVEHGPWERRR
ncbi:MAG: NAD/NADP octopine/nopaline dehydrogenase family protein [Armatimonadota bacterium]|nr:NAD/NADP octopine/nopaline dehydrogenase family protein [Armatimonadota bacterium]MDR7451214.1 NAD/NADP octopine/nopaline dehydrogenase family protein [Armatimonadota bacterium]MDR7467181.1 NAD/NADP octopine/nopaline dehydrogenase family protein [Armatimonadota bacterium]MDR7495194.1 NAD/NADP octopine/nopaline dehydrogenase family protein [Armatimonadota bacterium]MDR7500095.1 NAD/NADP octopine/nopaline dehydrogenase family protein [Armatimonadota bacterium]